MTTTSTSPLGRLNGSGYIIDTPGARVRYDVESANSNDKIQFVLRAANSITWWKSLDIFVNVNGTFVPSKRIETKDRNRERSVDYFEFEMTTAFKLEFWKGGMLGFGAYVTALLLDSYTNLGKRIVFTWEDD